MLRQEECPKPMHTLRSGKVVDNKVGSHEQKEATREEKGIDEQTLHQQNEERRATAGAASGSKRRRNNAPQSEVEETRQKTPEKSKEEAVLPYPQRLGKAKRDKQFLELYFMLSKVQINLPLIEMIENVPLYVKFFKELCSKKRKLGAQEKIFASEVVNSVLQYHLPPKKKDPGSFNVDITIGDGKIVKAMLDLGASINLMPYSIYAQLGLGELKRTSMSLQLADRSVKYPKGIIEDLLVRVDKLIVPVDFVVMEMENYL